jgi:hypothetical protein
MGQEEPIGVDHEYDLRIGLSARLDSKFRRSEGALQRHLDYGYRTKLFTRVVIPLQEPLQDTPKHPQKADLTQATLLGADSKTSGRTKGSIPDNHIGFNALSAAIIGNITGQIESKNPHLNVKH